MDVEASQDPQDPEEAEDAEEAKLKTERKEQVQLPPIQDLKIRMCELARAGHLWHLCDELKFLLFVALSSSAHVPREASGSKSLHGHSLRDRGIISFNILYMI